ncbi:MAG: hypothetical protein Q9190_004455 [Brigantiaea leucoxantha]
MAQTATLTKRPITSISPEKTVISPIHVGDTIAQDDLPAPEDTARGAAVYSSSWLLALYDWWVLGIVSTYAWACSVPEHTLPFFRRNVTKGGRHLDIGVGTGYYLANTDLRNVQLTLADLNQDALDATKARLVGSGQVRENEITDVLHDVTRPLPASCGKFDSISMYYLLHCMPGPAVPAKTATFGHLKYALTENGVVSGASILGKDVSHNLFGRAIMFLGNNVNGMFDNRGDSAEDFEEALRDNFEEVECETRGAIFLFRARKPKV